jgi:hypothetical protein
VFNAAEAFHSGRLEGCSSLSEAEVEALGQFSHEVQLLQRVAGDGSTPALGGTAPPCLSELPSCSGAVVTMLDYSKDQGGRPGRAADGCCYLVLELGLFTMEQLARDSREVGRRPSVPEVREAVGSLLGMVAELHLTLALTLALALTLTLPLTLTLSLSLTRWPSSTAAAAS